MKPWRLKAIEDSCTVVIQRCLGAALAKKVAGHTRFRDTLEELRVRLRLTVKMHGGGEQFYHESKPREAQVLSATLSGDGKTLDVTVFLSRLARELDRCLKTPWKGKQDKW